MTPLDQHLLDQLILGGYMMVETRREHARTSSHLRQLYALEPSGTKKVGRRVENAGPCRGFVHHPGIAHRPVEWKGMIACDHA
jgi:hypothetical protein